MLAVREQDRRHRCPRQHPRGRLRPRLGSRRQAAVQGPRALIEYVHANKWNGKPFAKQWVRIDQLTPLPTADDVALAHLPTPRSGIVTAVSAVQPANAE